MLRRALLLVLSVTVLLGAAPGPASAKETLRLRAAVRALPQAAETPRGYDRDLFEHWVDADGDCQDTREEVLVVESVVPISGCTVTTGEWLSWYDGKTWTRSNAFPLPEKFNQIQPTLFETKAGNIVALMRSSNPRVICRAESKDGGVTFSPAEETKLPNPSAGVDCGITARGDVFLSGCPTAGLRTAIRLAQSTDDGKTWTKVLDLETEPGEYSYPAMIVSAAGTLEITYTWKRTHIKYRSVDPKTLRG